MGSDVQESPATPSAAPQPGASAKSNSAAVRHQRNPSLISVPESDISSSGTFIDKGSLDDVPALANTSQTREGGGPGEVDQPGDVGATAAVEEFTPLQPPESAFSSDMSEQHSGQVP